MVRKEGLEPSRCYPQVPETCASTSSATFAGREMVAVEFVSVKDTVGPRFRLLCSAETPEPPAARLPVPPLSQSVEQSSNAERVKLSSGSWNLSVPAAKRPPALKAHRFR